MTHKRPDNSNTLCCILILLINSFVAKGDLQDLLNLQHRGMHLEEKKFPDSDYADTSDMNEQDEPDNDFIRSRIPMRHIVTSDIHSTVELSKTNITSTLDPNIKWDKDWDSAMSNLDVGQLSAVDIDLDGNIALFSRRERIWGLGTFDLNNIFDINKGPIKQNTIILFNKKGEIIVEWGKNMFYMPHGLTIDSIGNYWLTDVAMHQVFKFNAVDIEKNLDTLKQLQYEPPTDTYITTITNNNLFTNSILKPSLILGEAFQPGSDDKKFCKPTAVAVAENGDFFVSDGYCNSRVIKFNSAGERILTIGRRISTNNNLIGPYSLSVPHALTLADELNFIYVADREHGRVLCYYAHNGSFHREYKNSMFGGKIYGVAYSHERLYLVNGINPYTTKFHVRGYVVDIYSGEVISQFGPDNDMIAPHDIAVNKDDSEIYVPELNKNTIYRFLQGSKAKAGINSTLDVKFSSVSRNNTSAILMTKNDSMINGSSVRGKATTLILTLVISTLLIIGLCVVIAAVIVRCQKRGRSSLLNESSVEFRKLVE
ncbi:hypothetical protein PV327_008669 [Microctonus hyperodae]|uniref:peptidylamidoglycolate lyase n=1 Tax=Microctonus hyperodae TaxID=165561 RepID=A0AA39KHP3_MICHY|nr:hypothetical protein PV327_008669 [Microctonus hyperodae]